MFLWAVGRDAFSFSFRQEQPLLSGRDGEIPLDGDLSLLDPSGIRVWLLQKTLVAWRLPILGVRFPEMRVTPPLW